MAPKTKDQIMTAVTDALHDTFGIERAKLVRESKLYEDLEIDSIDAAEDDRQAHGSRGVQIGPDHRRRGRRDREAGQRVAPWR
jgi:hypothetical protein